MAAFGVGGAAHCELGLCCRSCVFDRVSFCGIASDYGAIFRWSTKEQMCQGTNKVWDYVLFYSR